jgi:DNA repair protein REV1
MQKLDAGSGCAPTAGQGRLPFRPAPDATTASTITGTPLQDRASSRVLVTPQLDPEAPVEQITERVDLPSFSQVDMTVFEALPEDIRKELEAEYRRRSAPPPKPELPAEPPPHAASVTPSRGNGNDRFRVRRAGASRGRRGTTTTFARQARGTASWLQPPRGSGNNGPSRGRPTIPAFAAPASAATIRIRAGELAELGIDEDVFAALPVRIQREQLAAARGARVRTSQQPVRPTSPLKPLQRLAGRWAPPKRPHEYIPPPPPPRARFAEAEKPALRAGIGGGVGGRTSSVVEGVDVRQVVRAWVERFEGHEPHVGDVALVGGYLVRCAETDVGAERAVGVMRWWGALLRRRWAVWEHADERDEEPEPGEDVRAEMVGMAWWRAYREVGSQMNEVVRKRFGGGHLKFR